MLYVECYPDEVLVKILGVPRKKLIHEGGKFEICKRLQRVTNSIGLIEYDNGRTHPLYLRQCQLLLDEHDIQHYLERRTQNSIIIIKNTLEEWIIKKGFLVGCDPTSFGLSNEPKQLHKEINSKLQRFERFVFNLLERKSPALQHLQKLITR